MEALAAFGLAANVAQFISIAGKTIEKTIELSTSRKSLLEENVDLERIVQGFQSAIPQIEQIDPVAIGGDDKLRSLAQGAKRIADEIQTKLDKIKTRRSTRRHAERFFVTLRELHMKDELQDLSQQLASFRSEITMHINFKLIRQQSQIRDILVGNSQSNYAFRNKIQSQLNDLIDKVKTLTLPVGIGGRNIWSGNSTQLGHLVDEFRSWHSQALDFQRVRKVLGDLQFGQIEERRNAILQAHKNTYRWILDSDVANLKAWLTTEDAPIYWISGSAGSGKSTLMKCIYENPRLRLRLAEWVGNRGLYIASHFFWSGGTALQRSQEGLLRTLLFQILLERLDLVPSVFPARWNRMYNHSDTLSDFGWSTKELLDALFSLPSILGPDRLFILIDGLDEYDGEYDKLLEEIKSLGETSSIKLCISSRPWLDFIDAFEGMPWKLYLQDLTRSDISTYINDELASQFRFKQLSLQNEVAAQDLVEKITTKAQGVFLWVYLVVKSMIRGLVDADSMKDLHRRLDDLPQQLEDFFDRILASIDDFYRARTARVFLTMAHARTSIPLISFYFLDREDELAFDPKSFMGAWPKVNQHELQLLETKKRQLIAQCKDLIQIAEKPNDPILFNFSASFLHRTVIDFIAQSRIAEKLIEDAGEGFSPITTLYEINAGQFESLIHLLPRLFLKPYLRSWYLASIYYARESEVSLHKSMTQRLDQITESLINYLENRSSIPYSFSRAFRRLLNDGEDRPYTYSDESLLDLAVSCGLRLYVIDKLEPILNQMSKNILLKTLRPSLSINKDSEFTLGPIAEELKSYRPAIPQSAKSATPTFDNTFHMYTEEEEEIFLKLRSETQLTIRFPSEESDDLTVALPGPQRSPKPGKFGRIWRKISRQASSPFL
ncbi:hypothetical protein F5B19DRAFT_64893 [Rostrohypoxylon terebratum]|nr:hypothetical protein F5B19DRAFT_64893 [Rostrohypoxylon terebratum]